MCLSKWEVAMWINVGQWLSPDEPCTNENSIFSTLEMIEERHGAKKGGYLAKARINSSCTGSRCKAKSNRSVIHAGATRIAEGMLWPRPSVLQQTAHKTESGDSGEATSGIFTFNLHSWIPALQTSAWARKSKPRSCHQNEDMLQEMNWKPWLRPASAPSAYRLPASTTAAADIQRHHW